MKILINFFVRYPAMVNLGLLLTLVVGMISFSQVRYTLDPSEEPKEIYIDLTYRGASPLEIEERVISRIEENLRGINGMDRFTSISRENSGRITVELFEWVNITSTRGLLQKVIHSILSFKLVATSLSGWICALPANKAITPYTYPIASTIARTIITVSSSSPALIRPVVIMPEIPKLVRPLLAISFPGVGSGMLTQSFQNSSDFIHAEFRGVYRRVTPNTNR